MLKGKKAVLSGALIFLLIAALTLSLIACENTERAEEGSSVVTSDFSSGESSLSDGAYTDTASDESGESSLYSQSLSSGGDISDPTVPVEYRIEFFNGDNKIIETTEEEGSVVTFPDAWLGQDEFLIGWRLDGQGDFVTEAVASAPAAYYAVVGSVENGQIKIGYGYEGERDGVAFCLYDLGTEVDIHADIQRRYLNALGNSENYDIITAYVDGKSENSRPSPVVLGFEVDCAYPADGYEVLVSENEDMTDAYVFETTGTMVEVYNLKVGTVYYWNVSCRFGGRETVSGTAAFTTSDVLPRNVYVDGITNFRDLGGRISAGGDGIKQGLIFRCGRTDDVTLYAANEVLIKDFGIKTEIDLRSASESYNMTASPIGESVAYYGIPMTFDGNVLTDNFEQINKVFAVLANEENYPLLFHCSIGTDRTGMVAFLIRSLLGADEKTLCVDYVWSAFGNINGTRSSSVIKQYISLIGAADGSTFKEKTYNYLAANGVDTSYMDETIRILSFSCVNGAHFVDYGSVTKAPDCTNTGVMTYHCAYCDGEAYSEILPALGHADVGGDGLCDRCAWPVVGIEFYIEEGARISEAYYAEGETVLFPTDALPEDEELLGWRAANGDDIVTTATATAPTSYYAVLVAVCDNTDVYAADFDISQSKDYVLSAEKVGDDFNVKDLTGVSYNGEDINFAVDGENVVFDNADIRAIAVGDHTFALRTAAKIYYVKIAVVTKIIRNVDDLNYIGLNKNKVAFDTGYYVLGNDIDGSEQGVVNELSVWCGDNFETSGFRGVFDGRGHVLKNLKLNNGRLFYGVGNNAVIKNFALIDPVQIGSSDYVLASGVHHATIEDVVVRTDSKYVIGSTWRHTVVRNCLFVVENGDSVVGTAGNWGNRQSKFGDLYLVVATPTPGTLDNGASSFAGLIATHYQAGDYRIYKEENDIKEYTGVSSMLVDLQSVGGASVGNIKYLTFDDGNIYYSGQLIIEFSINFTSPSYEVYAGEKITLSADNSTFELVDQIDGVTVGKNSGVLTVGGNVAVGTVITVRADSKLRSGYYEQLTVTVSLKPIDLTNKGVLDVELGSPINLSEISGDVLAIKTATGNKIALSTANVVTQAELNAASGVNWSENLAITLYTSGAAYHVNAAFITKVIRTISDLKAIGETKTSIRLYATSYLVLVNDIDGSGQDAVNAISEGINADIYKDHGFRGVLDGRGHALKNLRLQEGMLFWGVGKGGVVKNLALIDPVQLTAREYCLARDLGNSTVSNVVVKADAAAAILCTYRSASVEKSVFILETGGKYVFKEVGQWGDHQTTFKNLAIVVATPTAVTLGNGAESFAGLIGTHYVQGSYVTFKSNRKIYEYATSSALLSRLSSSNFISSWGSPYISYADGHLKFNGNIIV